MPSPQVQAVTTSGDDGGLDRRVHPHLYLGRDPGQPASHLASPLVFLLPSWEVRGRDSEPITKGRCAFLREQGKRQKNTGLALGVGTLQRAAKGNPAPGSRDSSPLPLCRDSAAGLARPHPAILMQGEEGLRLGGGKRSCPLSEIPSRGGTHPNNDAVVPLENGNELVPPQNLGLI